MYFKENKIKTILENSKIRIYYESEHSVVFLTSIMRAKINSEKDFKFFLIRPHEGSLAFVCLNI